LTSADSDQTDCSNENKVVSQNRDECNSGHDYKSDENFDDIEENCDEVVDEKSSNIRIYMTKAKKTLSKEGKKSISPTNLSVLDLRNDKNNSILFSNMKTHQSKLYRDSEYSMPETEESFQKTKNPLARQQPKSTPL
jgi:hypothetical protein